MILKNYFRVFLASVAVVLASQKGNSQVVINEYSCSNLSITDNFGDTPDWVELYNAGATSVSLAGYYISDKLSNPTKWPIPAGVTINAGGFIRIWGSGRNTVSGSNIHAGIKFTQTKPEGLCFADPSGAILDSMTLNPTQAGHSRGRTTDGASTWSVFTTPTPNATNTGALLDYAARPVMSVAAGFYAASQTVTITASGTGITIHYTTDGSVPTAASTTYSAPVSVSSTTVLRARAFSSNPSVPPSFVESNTYFINQTHTVPVVSVFGDLTDDLLGGNSIVAETGLEYFDATQVQVAETQGEANEHGNDSWAYNQRGFDFVSRDEMGYNYGINYKIFPTKSRKSFQRIIFKAAANDNYPQGTPGQPAHIRDAFAHNLSQRGHLNLDERSWAPAIVYLNGQYWGVYDVREKVDDLDFTSYYDNQDDPNVQFLQTWGGTWSAYGGAQAQTDWNALESFITSNSMAVPSNYAYVDSLFNVKSFVDYFVFNSWLVTSDWLNWNTAWWRGLDPAGDKKKWRYTLWDLDAIMGHYINYTGIPDPSPNADPCNVDALPDPGGQGHALILNALMANPDFKQYYEARYIDLMNTTLNCTNALAVYDSMIAVIDPEMTKHCAKWGGSYAGWKANTVAFRTDISDRCAAMTQGMIDCYSLTGPYNVTFDVSPAGAGKIRINSITPSSYIYSGSYFGGIVTKLKATPNAPYVFDHWQMTSHTPTPSSVSDSAEVTFTTSENVIAVFRKTDEPQGGEEVGVPNAFSPNGDNNNDILYVLGSVDKLDFQIFNRWGQQVFHSTDRKDGWDGTFQGQACNPGVFAYRISGILPDGKPVERKGNITLVR
jgi:gliding motility-associated-like protein